MWLMVRETALNVFLVQLSVDENRVRLEVTSRHTSDYVNASYIKVSAGGLKT